MEPIPIPRQLDVSAAAPLPQICDPDILSEPCHPPAEQRWSDELATGIEALDHQHQTLLGLIDRISPRPDGSLEEAAAAIIDYSKAHFDAEEEFMETIGFPLARQHRIKHQAFDEQFAAFFRWYRSGRVDYLGFRQYVTDPVSRHILNDDLLIAQFIADKQA